MVSRTATLLDRAQYFGVDGAGQRTVIKASSWRAGGVRSATDAGIAGPVIMALGRWRSLAWAAYALYDVKDLQHAASRMWVGSSKNAQGVAEVEQRQVANTHHLTPEFDTSGLRASVRQLPSTTFQ